MVGRGIDQILPHPADPQLYESYVTSAAGYVALAEAANGPIPRPVPWDYVWGAAPAAWRRAGVGARIINLETSITASLSPWPKGINYKMAPDNANCLAAAEITCCTLANNHVLDWGEEGLLETLDTLRAHGIATAGAGRSKAEAAAPAVIPLPTGGRLLVFAFGHASSGIPWSWDATPDAPGLNLLPDLTVDTLHGIGAAVAAVKRPGDIAMASLHWGANWGYGIPAEHHRFARALVDDAGIDVVHGHSSHHAKGLEVYRGRLILYGCGDFLNDYEGIAGYEEFRPDLVLSYLPRFAAGQVQAVTLLPFQIRNFRLNRPSPADVDWLRATLDRESAPYGTGVVADRRTALRLTW